MSARVRWSLLALSVAELLSHTWATPWHPTASAGDLDTCRTSDASAANSPAGQEGLVEAAASTSGNAAPVSSSASGVEGNSPALSPSPARLKRIETALANGQVQSILKELVTLAEQYPNDLEVQFLLLRARLRAGDNPGALKAGAQALKLDPGCAPVLLLYGEALEASRRNDEALQLYQEGVKRQPDALALRLRLSDRLIAKSKLEEAAPHLQAALDARPQDPALLASWAELLAWRGKASEAVDAFQRTLSLDARSLTLARRRTYAEALRQVGRPQDALEQLNLALKQTPRDPALLLSQGLTLVELKRTEEGIAALRTSVKLDPRSAYAQASLARALTAADRRAEGRTYYLKAISLTPDDDNLRVETAHVISALPEAREEAVVLLKPLVERPSPKAEHLLALAELLSWQAPRRLEAFEWLNKVLAQEPLPPRTWEIYRNVVLWSPPSAALVPFAQRAFDHQPNDLELLFQLAASLSYLPAQARNSAQLFERLLLADPTRGEARIALGELLLTHGAATGLDASPERIRRELLTGAQTLPERPDLQLRAAEGLLKLQQFDDARACFERCLNRTPGDVRCLTGQVTSLASASRYSEALVTLEKALTQLQGPVQRQNLSAQRKQLERAVARANEQALEQAGKHGEAEAIWRTLLEQDSNDIDGQVVMGGLLSRRGAFEQALARFQRALSLKPDYPPALDGQLGSLVALNRPEEALQVLERRQKQPGAPDLKELEQRLRAQLKLKEAQNMLAAGRKTSALALLETLYNQNRQDVEVGNLYAGLLMEEKRWKDASEVYRRVVEKDPSQLNARRELARALWEQGAQLEARNLLKELMPSLPPADQSGVRLQLASWEAFLAEQAKTSGDNARALEHYRQAYALAPQAGFVMRGLAGLYWSNGQLELASKFYAIASARDPKDAEALQGASETFLLRGMPQAVVKLLESSPLSLSPELKPLLERARTEVLLVELERAWKRGDRSYAESMALELETRVPRRSEPWLRLARLASLDNENLLAIRWYYRCLELEPDRQEALLALVAALQASGRYVESGDIIRQMRLLDARANRVTPELDPLEAASWAARADLLVRRGQREQALDAYRRALELGLDAGWLLRNVARLYADNNQPEQALRFVELSMKTDADSREAHRSRASILLGLQRPDEAASSVAYLTQTGELTPGDMTLKAELYKQQGMVKEALELYRTLRESLPNDVGILRGLVGVLLATELPWEALELLNNELVSQPLDPVLLKATAAALRGLFASDLAVPVLRKLRKHYPGQVSEDELNDAMFGTLLELSEAAKERNDLRRARQYLDEALRMSPGSSDVLRGLAGLDARERKFESAGKRFREALRGEPDDPIAISGRAAALAAVGSYYPALEVLQAGWRDTRAPRVGLEWVQLLMDRERYVEADLVLREVEAELGLSPNATEDEVDALLLEDRASTRMIEALQRFEQIWPRVARKLPAGQVVASKSLPVLQWRPYQAPTRTELKTPPRLSILDPSLMGNTGLLLPSSLLSAGPEGSQKSSSTGKPELPDLAPELPVPRGFADLQQLVNPNTLTLSNRVDLWQVDRILRDMRSTPVQAREEDVALLAPERRPVINPWQEEMQRGEGEAPLSLAEDTDDYSAYRPLLTRGRPVTRYIPPIYDPVAQTVALRKRLDTFRGNRLQLGGFVMGRSGSAGTTAMFAAFGDLRLGLELPGLAALTLEPYVQPGMITDGEDFQNGTMVGVGFSSRPGRFSLAGQVGTSPLGFRTGGLVNSRLSVDVDASDLLRLSAEGAFEPVTDSLLSWAGKVTEKGVTFGGVTRSRAGGTISLLLDGRTTLMLGGDLARYQGTQLPINLWRQGRVGFLHDLTAEDTSRLQLRVKTTAFGFAQQLDDFELGQGGYFSPLLFLVATGGGFYRYVQAEGRIQYGIGVDGGVQYVQGEETDSLKPGLRAVLTAELEGRYVLSPGLELSARYEFDNVGAEYQRNVLWLNLSRRFGQNGRSGSP
ncbi:MAG: tetratricopeptide repeat protein [Myxococcota bacterium]